MKRINLDLHWNEDLVETTGEEAAFVRSCATILLESDSGLSSAASFYDLGPTFGTIEQLALCYDIYIFALERAATVS